MIAITTTTIHLRPFAALTCIAFCLSLNSWMNYSGSLPCISAVIRIPESLITCCLFASQSRLYFFFNAPKVTPVSSLDSCFNLDTMVSWFSSS